jgi:hypothetical protein
MNTLSCAAGSSARVMARSILVSLLSSVLLLATWPQKPLANEELQGPAPSAQTPPHTQQTPSRRSSWLHPSRYTRIRL